MFKDPRSRWTGVSIAVAALLALAACGSSAASSGSSAGAGSGSGTADTAAAKALLADYTGKPSAFPVDQPLTKHLPSGATFAYLQCSSPVCGLIASVLKGATQTLGVKLTVVNAGASVTAQQAGLESIKSLKPSGVLIAGIDLTGVGDQVKALTSAGIPVATIGIQNTGPYGVQAPFNSNSANTIYGQLLAAYVVEKQGAKVNSVVYEVPELSFSPLVTQAYISELAKLCPSCKVRKVDVPVTSMGADASSRVISDLQAHPSTNIGVFSDLDLETGLPAALKTAGIKLATVGLSPSPSGLQDIKNGDLGAAVAVDIPVMMWTAVDMTARIATGQPLTAGEQAGVPPLQVLQQADMTFDPSHGWSGYPDFAQRFATLWKG